MSKARATLSPIPYIKNNKRRTLTLIVSLGLFASMIYLFGYILASTSEPFYEGLSRAYERMTFVCENIELGEYETNEEWDALIRPVMEKSRDKARKDLGNDNVFIVRQTYAVMKGVMGQSGVPVTLFDNPSELKTYCDHMGMELTSGRMPQEPGELIVSNRLYRNSGDGLLSRLSGSYRIVGFADSPFYTFCGISLSVENNYMLVILHGEGDDVVKKLEEKGWDLAYYSNFAQEKESFENETGYVDDIKAIFTSVGTSLLCICIMVILSIHIRDRHEEWCLYSSIGYPTGEIWLLATRELLICFAAGLAFGAVFTAGALALLDCFLMAPLGLSVTMIRPDDIILVLLMITAVFGLCQIPLFLQIRKITTVDEIE
ncbi:MAG: hypothetical protein IKN14_09240 [Clostridiales bacterium]|nr:hypothetical protein [Clostridiales bacterium]